MAVGTQHDGGIRVLALLAVAVMAACASSHAAKPATEPSPDRLVRALIGPGDVPQFRTVDTGSSVEPFRLCDGTTITARASVRDKASRFLTEPSGPIVSEEISALSTRTEATGYLTLVEQRFRDCPVFETPAGETGQRSYSAIPVHGEQLGDRRFAVEILSLGSQSVYQYFVLGRYVVTVGWSQLKKGPDLTPAVARPAVRRAVDKARRSLTS